jgi:glutathione S-transferase
MLTIWGRISSINVRKVVFTAQELGLRFQRIDAGREFGIVRTPEYLARNPNALVPLLQDGDLELWESNVIVRYLCAKHSAGELYPAQLPRRFDAERWMDWQQTTLNPAGSSAFVQWFRTPVEQRDMERIAQSSAATEPLMAMLDAHLAPALHGRRPPDHGRHPDRLRSAPLAGAAAAASRAPAPAALV